METSIRTMQLALLPCGVLLFEQLPPAFVLRLDCDLEPSVVISRWLTANNHGTLPASVQARWRGGHLAPTLWEPSA